jgi:hypothetical protein
MTPLHDPYQRARVRFPGCRADQAYRLIGPGKRDAPGKREAPAPDVFPDPQPTPLEDDPANDVEPIDHPETPVEIPPPDVIPGNRPLLRRGGTSPFAAGCKCDVRMWDVTSRGLQ